jgi:hypothetical protein
LVHSFAEQVAGRNQTDGHVGRAARQRWLSVRGASALVMLGSSTIGVSPFAVMVLNAPSRSSASIFAENDPVSLDLVMTVPPVRTERTFSSNAGLAASTDAPGSTAPDPSFTTPVIEGLGKEGRRNEDNPRERRHVLEHFPHAGFPPEQNGLSGECSCRSRTASGV